MILGNLPEKDVKVGIRIYAPRLGKNGTVVSVCRNDFGALIAVKWDDGSVTDKTYHISYMRSEIIDGQYFIISNGKGKIND